MRIRLTGKDVIITDQLQAYAEYRLFTSLARYGYFIRAVNVTLRPIASKRDAFLCNVVVDSGPSGPIKTGARGPHPNAAIDRAADRIASLLSRRGPKHVST